MLNGVLERGFVVGKVDPCLSSARGNLIGKLGNSRHAIVYPSGEPAFIEPPRDFKSDGGQHDVVLKLKKSLYGQAKDAQICYKKPQNGLL